jgi:hypothetical protein
LSKTFPQSFLNAIAEIYLEVSVLSLASDLKGHIRAIILANEVGNHLVEVVADKSINPSLISAFVSGLTQLGRTNLGVLNDISMRGQSLNLIVLYKYELVLIAIFDPKVSYQDAQVESANVLEDFYKRYNAILAKWDGNQEAFENYERSLKERIAIYNKRVHESKESLFSKLQGS